jgi:FtsP/CotA-like multicopper oxidase with cupredoxin domain
MAKALKMMASVAMLTSSLAASAQITYLPVNPAGPDASFPPQNPQGPAGIAYQSNYPYEGQCVADPLNAALFPLLPPCQATDALAPGYAPSFACAGGTSAQSAASTACGAVTAFRELNPLPVDPAIKYLWEVLNPPDYTPDTTTFPNAHYYEIGLHEAWGFDGLAKAGVFPNPGAAITVPNGKQWTGIRCSPVAPATTCTGGVPAGAPLFTPVWGVGQINMAGGPVTSTLATLGLFDPAAQPEALWSANGYVATWPSINIRAKRGTPVVVKWVNEFPNNHVFCPHPEAADWPCAIDRTFMGVKSKIDPALANAIIPPEGVNAFGSPQQPDNSWVTHLHGGEIPPSTDGFAEKWFGNRVTAAAYSGFAKNYLSPPFESPLKHPLSRPDSFEDTYAYPMVQEEALIWFHDHTLGKTHHNVIAGPAGFFPVEEPLEHSDPGTPLDQLSNMANDYTCLQNGLRVPCKYGWLDILTQPRDGLRRPLYDLFLAVQDRAFNDDGSIDFSNGLGQALPNPGIPGYKSVTAGANPMVHPVWVPEYFGDHALVNGVAWPKATVARGWYRIRMVDGSDSRCWTIGFSTTQPAPGTPPVNDVPFHALATDQGYLKQPIKAVNALGLPEFTMCPGERYELLVNFNSIPAGVTKVFMTNSAGAPFPFGLTPFDPGSPWPDMNTIMVFDVGGVGAPAPIPTCRGAVRTSCLQNPDTVQPGAYAKLPVAGATVRQVYLNEKVDGVTLAPLGMQLNGVPFEYKVTETPIENSIEIWQFINLTVDAHPMHPHLVKHQIQWRQPFDSLAYKALLCGSPTCQPGPAPGNEMQVVPDVTPLLLGLPIAPAVYEAGWKDASPAPPDHVTSIIARWEARWPTAAAPLNVLAPAPAPGQTVLLSGAYVKGLDAAACQTAPTPACDAANWVYEDVTEGPYVWHCHINSHEDSEMMRTSLVVR